ncbi:uncharacterized protein [Prorops nasuta]|uniref:uncharacterized protein n=1 Tax=Prorops nasuta TaxID=863751 RepID=UPI0034D021D7
MLSETGSNPNPHQITERKHPWLSWRLLETLETIAILLDKLRPADLHIGDPDVITGKKLKFCSVPKIKKILAACGKMADDNGPPEEIARVEVGAVSVKPPPFWRGKPRVWFRQLEAQFHTAGIKVDETKFNYVLQALDPETLEEVGDAIFNEPPGERYNKIKRCLEEVFADSEQRRLKLLLSELELGDQRPSQLFRRMKDLAGTKMSDDFLKSLWLQRLPTQAQAILSTSEVDLATLAQLADRICEVFTNNSSMVVASVSSTKSTLEEQISSLSKQVSELACTVKKYRRNHSRSRDRHSSKNRRTSKDNHSQDRGNVCWYHHRFANKAKKCTEPCNWKNSGSQENQ